MKEFSNNRRMNESIPVCLTEKVQHFEFDINVEFEFDYNKNNIGEFTFAIFRNDFSGKKQASFIISNFIIS